jgi:hypothetical protein
VALETQQSLNSTSSTFIYVLQDVCEDLHGFPTAMLMQIFTHIL